MNVMVEAEYNYYQGITFDERMAIRHLFISDDDAAEQPPAGSLSEGTMQ